MYWDYTRNMSNIGKTIGSISQTIGDVIGDTTTIFTDFSDSLWEDYYYFHVAVRTTTCFFFRWCPPEELDNKRSSARRGEFDSSTPEVIGVLSG